jgi:hypothetical protein
VEFLVARDDLAGPVNLAAPGSLPQREFMRELDLTRRVREDRAGAGNNARADSVSD